MLSRLKFDLGKLSRDILDTIPPDKFSSTTTKFLDPAMGGGQFILAIIQRLRDYGHSDDNIKQRVFGIELLPHRLTYAVNKHKLVGTFEIRDFLEWSTTMKFDVIVGNPPFQEIKENGERKDQASNLWSKFWRKSFQLTHDTSIIALITPTTWLSPSADFKAQSDYVEGKNRLWDVFDSYTSRATVTGVEQHFPKVGSTFGYVIVDRSGRQGLEFTDGVPTDLGFRPQSNWEQVAQQLSKQDNLDQYFRINQDNTPDIRVSIPLTRTLTDQSIEILSGATAPTAGSPEPGLYLYIHVKTPEQAQQVQARIQECRDILNIHCKWSGFVNIQTVKMIRFTPIS